MQVDHKYVHFLQDCEKVKETT